MTLRFGDMAKEAASSSGLADFTLTGAIVGYASFQSIPSILVGDTVPYTARNGNEWEIGIATYNGASALARTTVLRSSNANAKVNFSAAPTVYGTVPSSQLLPPAFSAKDNAQQALTAATAKKVLFQTEELDTHGFYDPTTGRFQPTMPGWYWLEATTVQAASSNCENGLYKNGSLFKYGSATSGGVSSHAGSLVFLNGTTDYIEVFHTSGIAQNTHSLLLCHFSGFFVRAA